ncbi:uncharacterized protein LOC116186973 [Punica granatum]|uniref:Uncharacterized protein LOC116186973 n=1 Tax=Punica granatum TaxID=22663 RepID=A0A218XP39_PUNGR|nr:uncharacterized protein LOC116186973 [Punica granatum]OWM86747.1 hypothetical protein CDL15_Pgr015783 [Punica granatum]
MQLPAVAILLFLFSSPTLTSSEASSSSSFQAPSAQGLQNKVKFGLHLHRAEGLFGEAPISEPVDNALLILAAQRTRRKDPLNGFDRYTGGWNIEDRHYWASVGFTGAPLFAAAAIWFLGFGVFLLVNFICYFCSEREPKEYSRATYSLSLTLLVIFAITAVIGCLILYAGQGRFRRSTDRALEYLVTQADATVGKLQQVSDYIGAAKQTGVDQVFVPPNVQTDIDQIGTKLNSSAGEVAARTQESSNDIRHLLDSVRLALIATSVVMLLLTFLGLAFSLFGMQVLVYILVVIGWMLVAGTFILSGTFLLLHNAAGDTCVAMEEWVQNPSAHTAIDEILPCVDSATIQETLTRSKEVTYQLVEVVNQVITNVSNINFSPNFPTMYFNQSGPLVPILCNPFHADLTDRTCSNSEVDLNNATQVWRNFVCQVSPTGICTNTGRLTPAFYGQMSAVVNVSYGLYNYSPYLIELQDCTVARQTFTDIYKNHCPSLTKYSRWIYVGLAIVSAAVMMSIILWIIFGRERMQRSYTKQSEDETMDQVNEGRHKNPEIEQ